jgi:type II secretory pathway pseudopilin PulG
MQTSPAGKTAGSQKGFTYAAVLAAVVIVGIAAEITYLSTVRIVQAEREAELLFRGQAYYRAIERYYRANRSYPRSLEDLLEDPRSPSRRHIRALYQDPMAKETGQGWLLIRASDGGIGGVASRASGKPIKTANFPASFDKFNGAGSYSDWVFEYVPPTPAMGSKTVGEASLREGARQTPGATR